MLRQVKFHLRTLMAKHHDAGHGKVTYADITAATGLSSSTLSNLAQNKITRVDLDVISRICDFFGCDIGDLLSLEEAAEAPTPEP